MVIRMSPTPFYITNYGKKFRPARRELVEKRGKFRRLNQNSRKLFTYNVMNFIIFAIFWEIGGKLERGKFLKRFLA